MALMWVDFDSRTLAVELAHPESKLRQQPDFNERVMRQIRGIIDGCCGDPETTRAVLGVHALGARQSYDLGHAGRRPSRLSTVRRSPLDGMRRGVGVGIEIDAWPPRELVVEVIQNGVRHGMRPGAPAVMTLKDGCVGEGYWYRGYDVTEAVARPASTYAQAAAWSGDLGLLAIPEHARIMEVVAAAEAAGVAVSVHSDSLPGLSLYSPGGGRGYELIDKAAYKQARAKDTDAPSGILSIQSNAYGENWKAVRTVRGVLHGDTAELPAVCTSRKGHRGDVEVSEALMREGARISATGPVPTP